MTQKEREVTSKYGIMDLEENIKPKEGTSHEYNNTRSKKKTRDS